MKITAKELSEFYWNGIESGNYIDYDYVTSDGIIGKYLDDNWKVKDGVSGDETIDTEEIGAVIINEESGNSVSLDTAIKKWRKNRDYEVLMVTVAKNKVEEVKEALKKMDGVKVK